MGGGAGDVDQRHEKGVGDSVIKDLLPRYNFCCDIMSLENF